MRTVADIAPVAQFGRDDAQAPREADRTLGPPELERAHALFHRAARALREGKPSSADRRPAARALEAAIMALYDALDGRRNRVDAALAAMAETDRSIQALVATAPLAPPLDEAEKWLSAARIELSSAAETTGEMQDADGPTPLLASTDVPRLHRIAHASLAPQIKLADPLPVTNVDERPLAAPNTPEDIGLIAQEIQRRAEARRNARLARRKAVEPSAALDPIQPPAGFARGPFVRMSREAFVAAKARECFEEITMTAMHRTPLEGEPWRSTKTFEQRMLHSIDAIAALGSVALGRIEPLLVDSPAPDPSRTFAAIMILGCMSGRDTLGAIERILDHVSTDDPAMARAATGALKLVPHPQLKDWLRMLLGASNPAVVALAIEVLSYRGLVTIAQATNGLDANAVPVLVTSLDAVGLLCASNRALLPQFRHALDSALGHPDGAVRRAAWAAMTLSGHPRISEVLSAELDGPDAAAAALLLALGGEARSAARLIERAKTLPTASFVRALGWAGAGDSPGYLIELLEHRDPEVQTAAAEALDRLTGARLFEEVGIAPEAISLPDVQEPDTGEPKPLPLARAVSDPRDVPSDGAMETVLRPSQQASHWFDWWHEHQPSYKPAVRYRRGRPFSAGVLLWELDEWTVPYQERRLLQKELIIKTGEHVRFDPHDFVTEQERALALWKPIAIRTGAQAGVGPHRSGNR